jgi:beta-glucosidase
MRKQFPRAVVTYEPGASNRAFYLGEKVSQLVNAAERALTSAANADIVVAVVGISSEMEGEEGVEASLPGFSGGDRTTLDLPTEEEEFLRALKSKGKPLIVVLMNGSALSVNWAETNANAILEAWYAGEEGGTAVAETLAGVNNPAGRLPITFYKGVDQLPDFTDYSMQNRTYRYFNGEALYRFGYGLSYSKFEYKTPRLSTGELKQGETLTVEAEVKNVSGRDGDEVVQLYLEFPPVAGAPLRALRGFRRIPIKAGQSEVLKFTLRPDDLYMVNQDGHRIMAAGRYRLWVGGGQPGVSSGKSAEFMVQQKQQLPD